MARGIFVGLFFIHAQRGGVDTEAFAAMFGWAVVEDMTEVGAAACAGYLDALHAEC